MDYFINDTKSRIVKVEKQLSDEALSKKDRQKLESKLCDLRSLLDVYNHIVKNMQKSSIEITPVL